MTISVSCANCAARFKAHGKLLGRRVKCPKCGHPIVIARLPVKSIHKEWQAEPVEVEDIAAQVLASDESPEPPEAAEIPPEPIGTNPFAAPDFTEPELHTNGELPPIKSLSCDRIPIERGPHWSCHPLTHYGTMVLGVAGFLATFSQGGILGFCSYAAILIVGSGYFFRFYQWPATRIIGVVALLGLGVLHGFTHTYEATYDKPFQSTKNIVSHIDTTRFWEERVEFRRVEFGDGSSFVEGPLSASGKWHGHWRLKEVTESEDSTKKSSLTEEREAWFWYGEEVTEGKFRELDK